jgi:hypothetical protein
VAEIYLGHRRGSAGGDRPVTPSSSEPIYDYVLASSRSSLQAVNSSKPSCVYDARKLLADCKLPERILLLAELLKALTRKVDCDSLRDLRIAQPHLLEQGVVSRV